MATTKRTSTKATASTKAKAKVQARATKRSTAKPKAKVTTKAKAVSPNAKFGGKRTQVRTKVVSLRDKQHKSWADIGESVGVAPRTARRLYDEGKGKPGAHHGLLPGKGGRKPEA